MSLNAVLNVQHRNFALRSIWNCLNSSRSPRTIQPEIKSHRKERVQLKTTLFLNKFEFYHKYHKYSFFLYKNDALKASFITYKFNKYF